MLRGFVAGNVDEKEIVDHIVKKLEKRGNSITSLVTTGIEPYNALTYIGQEMDTCDFVALVLSKQPECCKSNPFRVLSGELRILESMAIGRNKVIYFVSPDEAMNDWI